MKIEKYIFHLPAAMSLASSRIGCPPLSPCDMFNLYAVRYLYPCKVAKLVRHSKECQQAWSESAIRHSCVRLHDWGLLSRDEKDYYTLTPSGRDYLSYVRRYLLHKRIK